LNYKDAFGFDPPSLAPVSNYNRKGRAMAFTGPGVASDWLDVDGPIHDVWPPESHRRLFGDLPLVEFKPADHPGVRAPSRKVIRQEIVHVTNRPDPVTGIWTVESQDPLADADRLLGSFLPKAFRRPVDPKVRAQYVERVAERLKVGDCFELGMRCSYRAALFSLNFLFHVEPTVWLDGPALACRLSYFLWNTLPDEALLKADLREPRTLQAQVERLLRDPRSQRFVEDFLGQWLKLRQIAQNDPDPKLYPEFSNYLQDSMIAETRAYFRELLEKNLDAGLLVKSDFAMLNEKLAVHYGIPGVKGTQIRRVPLRPISRGIRPRAIQDRRERTTSPVPGAHRHGAVGQLPERPLSNVPAVDPDVRGATTIREQLAKHRSDPGCASCHAKIDPPGFALEAFDVIGGQRSRYRSIGAGDTAPRGSIDPFIGIPFKLGLAVDASGTMADGRGFAGIAEFQSLLAADRPRLERNLAEQFLRYAPAATSRSPIEIAGSRAPRRRARTRSSTKWFPAGSSRPTEGPTMLFGFFAGLVVTLLPQPVEANHRITGLFSQERTEDLKEAFKKVEGVTLVRVDFDRALAGISSAPP
jgi:hypothetical protein